MGITPKICRLCLVLINSVLLNLLCVWIPTVIRSIPPPHSYYLLRGPDVHEGGLATGLILVTTALACTFPLFHVPRLCRVVDGVRTQTREPSRQAGVRVLPLVASASELTTAPTLYVEYNTIQSNTIQLYLQVSIQFHEECVVVPSTLITHSLQS